MYARFWNWARSSNLIRMNCLYPTRLILGFCDNRPVHIVAADAPDEDETVIITVYQPDIERWDSTFRRRIKP